MARLNPENRLEESDLLPHALYLAVLRPSWGGGELFVSLVHTDNEGVPHPFCTRLGGNHFVTVEGYYPIPFELRPHIPAPPPDQPVTLAQHLAKEIRARLGVWDDQALEQWFETQIKNYNAANPDRP